MIRAMSAGLLALPLLTGAALALPPQLNTYLGTDITSVGKALEGLGYEVLEIGEDESGFEAEILDGEVIYDVTVDDESGLISNVEIDTDEDGDA